MSFQPPTTKQESQSRKILEELQKKQQALKQQQPSSGNSISGGNSPSVKVASNPQIKPSQAASSGNVNSNLIDFGNNLTTSTVPSTVPSNGNQRERAALQHANQNSFGNYITQDSSFGNLILPVIPNV